MRRETVKELVRQWLAWDRNPETRLAIERLWAENNEVELQRLLGRRMTFGTAGLRASMGAGNACMNQLTIIQTTQGLAEYLREHFASAELATRGVLIGFDGRHYSNEFAQFAANVMQKTGIRTYLFSAVTPTPLVAFGIRYLGCVAGVMVTASHNPKSDNGYKVFWRTGAQIVSPHDSGISRAIEANLEPKEGSWSRSTGDDDPYDDIFAAYFNTFQRQYSPLGGGHGVRFAYTAMHGVGAKCALRALSLVGVPSESVAVVREQAEPDPDFPTVVFPNPEEGKSSLTLSFATANHSECSVILANDPDADRLAVAERQTDDLWRVFNGNEIAALLGWWAVHHAKKRGEDLSKCYFLYSTVSSSILRTIAEHEGMQVEDTLPGFKWMGTLAEEYERTRDVKVLLAFEEAIGYMWGTQTFDKDGVTACGVVADLACYLRKHEGCSLSAKLAQLYTMYGYHFSSNSYVVCPDPVKVKEMFYRIRMMHNDGYPEAVAGVRVKNIRDLSTGLDTRMPDKRATLPLSSSSPMLTFYFENGVIMTIRSSGTEPKLKWLTEMVTNDPNGQGSLERFVNEVVEELICPDAYGFERRKGTR